MDRIEHKMHIAVILTLTLVCLILPKAVAVAETYYIDAVRGNDSDPGTSEAPWRTVDRAMPDWGGSPRVSLGDTVILRDGNYGDVNFDYQYSDSVPKPQSWDDKIVYKADSGATPVFSHLAINGDPGYRYRYLEFDGIDVNVTTPATPYVDYGVMVYYSKSLRFRNMKITGYWTNTLRGGMTQYVIKFQTTEAHDFLVENCDISSGNTAIQFVGEKVTAPITVRNNHIHDISGHGIGFSVESGEKITVEGNYIHGGKAILDYHMIRCDSIIGERRPGEELIQDGTGARGILGYYGEADEIQVYPTTDVPWEVGPGRTIRGAGIIAEPAEIVYSDTAHQGGIMLRADNAEIKNNVIHGLTGTGGIHTFPGETYEPLASNGYCNLLVENNLIYDPSVDTVPGFYLADLGTNVTIRNNTFVGFRGEEYPEGSRNGWYYRVPARLLLKSGRDGSGIKLYNNIIVGALNLDPNWSVYEENNNLIYSVLQGAVWKTSLSGGSTIIYSDGYTTEPKVFDTDFFVDPDYSLYHGRVCDYRLKSGAPAINFGDPNNAPATDILGNLRDAKPDAGCYEYGASSNKPPVANAGTNQTITDKNKDGTEEVTLDGSGSKDPDGEIVSFIWSEGGLEIANGRKPTVTLSTGTHLITLTVSDNGGLTDTDTVTIKVLKEGEEFRGLPTGCYNNVINPLKGEEAIVVVELKERGNVKIDLYDTKGNKIKELADEEKDAGTYPYYWNGKNDSGNVVGCGLYFVHIEAGDYKKTKKIVVVK